MISKIDCKDCIHCAVCARKEAMQEMINELESNFYFENYNGKSCLISNVDWVRLTLTCSFFDQKPTKKL